MKRLREAADTYLIKYIKPIQLPPSSMTRIIELTQGESGIEFHPIVPEAPKLTDPLFVIERRTITITGTLPGVAGTAIKVRFPWKLIDRYYTVTVTPKDPEAANEIKSVLNTYGYDLVKK